MVSLRPAVFDDAEALAELGAATFTDTFGPDNRPEDIAQHVARSFGPQIQAQEIGNSRLATLVVEEGGQLIAYAQLREDDDPPSGVSAEGTIELWRFYIAREWHGRGLAQTLMRHVVAAARARGATLLWLGVWEHNPRAQRFYDKCGFRKVGSHVFVLGTDAQTDFVLSAPLSVVEAHLDSQRVEQAERRSDRASTQAIEPLEDCAAVRALLVEAGLPTGDLAEGHNVTFLGARSGEAVEGVVGLERYGAVGLLRSLAVAPAARSRGLGRALVDAAERSARGSGQQTLYLLTTTADRFFASLGYQQVRREQAPDAIQRSSQFQGLCPASAVFMSKSIVGDT